MEHVLLVQARAGLAQSFTFWQQAVLQAGGAHAVQQSLPRVGRAVQRVDGAAAAVPPQWWAEAGINPDEVCVALEKRARELPNIMNLRQWEGLSDAVTGGRPFTRIHRPQKPPGESPCSSLDGTGPARNRE
jgi:hypothetical protein